MLGQGVLGQAIMGRDLLRSGKFAPYWALDGNGRAYCTPQIRSPELFANGDFAGGDTGWTLGTGWSVAGGVAVGATTSQSIAQSVGFSSQFHRLRFDIVARTSGTVRPQFQSAYGDNVFSAGSYEAALNFSGTQIGVFGTSFVGSIDNLSAHLLRMNDGLMVVKSTAAENSVSAKFYTAPGLVISGVFVGLNSPLNMRSFLYARRVAQSGLPQRFTLNKSVNGSSSTLISATTASFVADADLEIRRSGTTYGLWYNGSQVGSDQIITDPEINDSKWCGAWSMGPVHRITSFSVNGDIIPFWF